MIGFAIWLVCALISLGFWLLFAMCAYYILKFAFKWCLVLAPIVLVLYIVVKECF